MYFVIDYYNCNQKIPKKQKQCQTQVHYSRADAFERYRSHSTHCEEW